MKKLLIILSVFICGIAHAQQPVNLIFIQGESNASGQACNSDVSVPAELTARAQAKIWNNSTNVFQTMQIGVNNDINENNPGGKHSMELALGNAAVAGQLSSTVYIVKAGYPGARIGEWLNGGSVCCGHNGFGTLIGWSVVTQRMDAAIAALNAAGVTYQITVWQSIGINDFNDGLASATFQTRMQQFENDFRSRYGANIAFIRPDFFSGHPYNTVFTNMASADPQGVDKAIVTDDLIGTVNRTVDGCQASSQNGAHWTYTGFKLFTPRMVAATPPISTTTTALTFSTIPTSALDLQRPYGGVDKWYTDNLVNIPNPAVASPRLDYYYRFVSFDVMPLNSPQGTYDFTKMDNQFKAAIDNGQRIAIGQSQAFSGNGQGSFGGAQLDYPVWIHNAMQASGQKDFIATIFGGQHWIPNYDNPTWIADRKALHQATYSHIIGAPAYKGVLFKDIVLYIECLEYGDYGEWATLHGSNASVASLDSLIANVVNSYPTFQVQGQPAMLDGGTISGFLPTPAGVGAFALSISNTKGTMGFSDLCLGCTDGYRDRWLGAGTGNPNTFTFPAGGQFSNQSVNFQNILNVRWQTHPMTGEPPGFDPNGDKLADLPNCIVRRHTLMFGNGNYGGLQGDATLQANARQASKNAGYRIALDSGRMTTTLTQGSSFNINLYWHNRGLTPNYENWNVQYELRNGATVVATYTSAFSINLFLPAGTPTSSSENFTLSGSVAPGVYSLYLIIRDPKSYRTPLPLYITTTQNADGSYLLRNNITVVAGTGPVANAGASQNIFLPTTSTTLDGSASSGSITAYSWTFVSGPATPGFTTPTAAITGVTGLTVAGTYIFQLSVNAGASISQTTVTVNPAQTTFTVFTNQVPVVGTSNDGGGINYTTGMKFRSSTVGYVTGVRFYKTTGNTGNHTGLLYTSTGTVLSSVLFTGETATGWQTMSFPGAVVLSANTTYVIALFNDAGNYTEQNGYFNGTAITNGPLTALADGTDGCNGPFDKRVLATPSFPTTCFQQANYWVDVVFSSVNPNVPAAPQYIPGLKRGHKRVFIKVP